MLANIYKRILSAIFIIPISFIIILKGSFLFIFFLITLLIISLYEWNKMNNSLFIKIFGFVFILFSFYTAYKIREFNGEENLSNFIVIITSCISTDVGGYFFGKLLKGPKLSSISPNKTYAGFFGGIFCALFFSYLIITTNFIEDTSIEFNLSFIFYVILISLISQGGDLIISYFKRKSNIKDTGNIIPGHGGILDRIDGMIFVFPIIYILKYLH